MNRIYLISLLIITSVFSYGQDVNVNITVEEKTPRYPTKYNYGTGTKSNDTYDFSKISNQYEANLRAQQAARNRVRSQMSKPNLEVEVPLQRDLYDFTHIAVVSAKCTNIPKAKNCFGNIIGRLYYSPLERLFPNNIRNRKKFKENNGYLRDIKDPNWLYVTYRESKQGYDHLKSLTIRDFENNVIFKSSSVNVPIDEVLSVLTDM